MNFPEYDCNNEEILELLSYLPTTTADDYSWMQKYIDDIQLHYEKAEYELAVISAHMIYMFIIYCFILKKREFNLNKVKCDFQDDREHCPNNQADLTPYLYVNKCDKKCFNLLKPSPSLKNNHKNVVSFRDNVAHCSGNSLSEKDFLYYIAKCVENIKCITTDIFNNFRETTIFNKALSEQTSYSNIIEDFLLSLVEYKIFIKDELIKKIKLLTTWNDMLNNTIPANYGINDYEFTVETIDINYDTIDDDIITGTFNADINIFLLLQMASSNPDDGYEENYNKLHQINGYFYCEHNLNEFNITIDDMPVLDLYAE